ncbi:MAG TPA: sulfatase [Candidatus Limnocylindria bacterium]|nr:sulfatase [Candidatus Limnocylindria bacterium]
MRGGRAVLLALALAACGREAPPRHQVSARLLEHVAGAVHLASGDCAMADEHRPSLGCTPWRRHWRTTVTETGRAPAVGFELQPGERGHRIFVKLYWQGPKAGAELVRLGEPQLARVKGARAGVPFAHFPPEVPAGASLHMWSRVAPPDHFETRPLAVPPGSVLSVGLGWDPETRPEHVDAIEYVITADAGSGERELLRTTLRPSGSEPAHWSEQRVPLDAVAGAAARFRLVTRVHPAAGVAPGAAVAVPLWGAPEILSPAPDDERPNVILVSLDTLRRDDVGAFGSPLPLTPNLDALAREGVVFENASTTYPSTTAAHLSMLTGLYPIRLGVGDPGRRVETSARLLAEAIGAAGWRTAAVTENVMLAIPVGFARGFSHYRENLENEPSEPPSHKVDHTFDAALAWLDANRDTRFFLFVHTYAVHFPYAAPVEYRLTTWNDGERERPVDEAPAQVRLRLRYAADVRHADTQVGRLVEAVRRLGLERETILVVTSDHGEAFYEHHDKWGHGMMIYDEIMRVPLIAWGPGRLPAGRRVRTPVSLVDVPPTILELAGAPPLAGIDGASQAARIHGAPEDLERVVYAESPAIEGFHAAQIAARSLTRKWIHTASEPPALVAYDLVADAGEQRPLDDPALLAEGRRHVEAYRGLGAAGPASVEIEISDEARKRLRALGYAH